MTRSTSYPRHNAAHVREASQYLLSQSQGDDRLCRFLRNYLNSGLTRVASNLVVLRGLMEEGSRLLDVGSFGVEVAILQKEFPHSEVAALALEGNWVGVEDDGLFEAAAEVAGAVQIQQIDVEREAFPFPDGHFDLVTNYEVLEHLKFSPVPMLREIKRVLKPTGRLILTTPNLGGSRALLKLLAGEPPQEVPHYHRSLDHGIVHPKEYTGAEILDLFTSLGFADVRITSQYFRKPMMIERLLMAALRVLRPLARRQATAPVLPGDNFVVTASKGGPVVQPWPATIFKEPN